MRPRRLAPDRFGLLRRGALVEASGGYARCSSKMAAIRQPECQMRYTRFERGAAGGTRRGLKSRAHAGGCRGANRGRVGTAGNAVLRFAGESFTGERQGQMP